MLGLVNFYVYFEETLTFQNMLYLVNAVILTALFIARCLLSVKVMYFGLMYFQLFMTIMTFVFPKKEDPEHQSSTMMLSITFLLFTIFNQHLINQILSKHTYKLQYFTLLQVYFGFVYRFIGIQEFFVDNLKVNMKIILIHVFMFLLCSFI